MPDTRDVQVREHEANDDVLARSADTQPGAPPEVTKSERFKLYSVQELCALPSPDWLIERVLGVGALAGLYGPSGEGKSFLALDWALSVATGRAWHGRAVHRGAVVYVAAEGGRSMGKRVEAWMHAYQMAEPRAFFLLEGLQVRDEEDLQLLATRIEALGIQPHLIVLDTLARCFVGGEENSAKEMGEFVEGLAWLQRKTQAAILVLHHTGKQGNEVERGSTALRAAADVMVRIVKDEHGVVTVKNNKQKDAEEFDSVTLQLQQVTVGSGTNGRLTSCILVPAESGTGRPNGAVAHLRPTLSALAGRPDGVATTAEWAAHTGLSERTFHSHRKKLVALGYVEALQRGRYVLTSKGRSAGGTAATAQELQLVHGNNVLAAATATTP